MSTKKEIDELEKLVMEMQGVDFDDLLNLAKKAYNIGYDEAHRDRDRFEYQRDYDENNS
jgi:hypothetical protein